MHLQRNVAEKNATEMFVMDRQTDTQTDAQTDGQTHRRTDTDSHTGVKQYAPFYLSGGVKTPLE